MASYNITAEQFNDTCVNRTFEEIRSFNTVNFTNTAIIERVHHGVPRFGHTRDITKLFAGTTRGERADYAWGLVAACIAVLCFFLIWMAVLVLFCGLGPERVGLLSGRQPRRARPKSSGEAAGAFDDGNEDKRNEEPPPPPPPPEALVGDESLHAEDEQPVAREGEKFGQAPGKEDRPDGRQGLGEVSGREVSGRGEDETEREPPRVAGSVVDDEDAAVAALDSAAAKERPVDHQEEEVSCRSFREEGSEELLLRWERENAVMDRNLKWARLVVLVSGVAIVIVRFLRKRKMRVKMLRPIFSDLVLTPSHPCASSFPQCVILMIFKGVGSLVDAVDESRNGLDIAHGLTAEAIELIDNYTAFQSTVSSKTQDFRLNLTDLCPGACDVLLTGEVNCSLSDELAFARCVREFLNSTGQFIYGESSPFAAMWKSLAT
jgi:hypothetical protein